MTLDGPACPLAGRWLQRLDHSMIFLLIARTGTAAFLLTPQSLCSGRPESAVGLTLTRRQRRLVPLGPHIIAAQAGEHGAHELPELSSTNPAGSDITADPLTAEDTRRHCETCTPSGRPGSGSPRRTR